LNLDFNKDENVLDDAANEFIERRSETRYKMCNGVFTVLKPHTQYSRLGSVIDISMGGIAFQYFLEKNITEKKFNELDIYISGEGLCLDNIPIRVTSAVEFPRIDRLSLTVMKRFGVQFLELAENKKPKLKELIENYTLHEI
jgi:hypothetical protein